MWGVLMTAEMPLSLAFDLAYNNPGRTAPATIVIVTTLAVLR